MRCDCITTILPLALILTVSQGPSQTQAAAPSEPPRFVLAATPNEPDTASAPAQQALAERIVQDQELNQVLQRARALLRTGLTAGSGYGEVWIRDLNTFLALALEVNEHSLLRDALLTFFKFQGPEGDIVDGYIPVANANVSYQYRKSHLAPDLLAHKNTVETDQETSLVQAVHTYIRITGDRAILEREIDGSNVLDRLERALRWLLEKRFDSGHGLLWGATTVDWGDVQPEHVWGVELDEHSHLAIDIYDNAMFVLALDHFLEWIEPNTPRADHWRQVRDGIRRNVRQHLWDAERQKFIPHIYLAGSPFPSDFDESLIWYHGGTAVAIEAGLLSPDEIRASLDAMRANVRKAGASSIGLTVYPPYPEGFFLNPSMAPWSYQNGGDWCWFGGRMIQQLIRHGLVADAYEELKPMVSRLLKNDGFFEWWTRDNQPRGSGQFRGSAGVLGRAIQMLQAWAEEARTTVTR
jgi:GH15 family glucan-1,4-alpha-glucosidase